MRRAGANLGTQLRSVSGRAGLATAWARRAVPGTEHRPLPATSEAVVSVAPIVRDGPRWEDDRLRRLEAILFLAREALSSRKLAQFANLADATEARTLIGRLNDLYDEAGCAFRVEEIAGGYQLLTRAKFATWLRRLGHVPAEVRLSAPGLETLAVIAYRQPVLRAEIEAIRGVNCGEILRQLMDRDLVRISGRSEELGRPYLYSTTKRFLQVFGLVNLDGLPRAETLRNRPSGPHWQPGSTSNSSTPPRQTDSVS